MAEERFIETEKLIIPEIDLSIAFQGLTWRQRIDRVRARGLDKPLVVIKKDDKYLVTTGAYDAAAALTLGLSTVPAIILESD